MMRALFAYGDLSSFFWNFMKDFWAKEASGILKSMLEREGVSYKELCRRLEKMGFSDGEEAVLRNKVNRGTFQFQFFLRCMVVLGYQYPEFEVRSEPPKPFEPSKSVDAKETAGSKK